MLRLCSRRRRLCLERGFMFLQFGLLYVDMGGVLSDFFIARFKFRAAFCWCYCSFWRYVKYNVPFEGCIGIFVMYMCVVINAWSVAICILHYFVQFVLSYLWLFAYAY